MNFGYLFEYYTPVTNSLTIFVGVRRLISHQTPGASKKWQQPPQTLHHFCHLKKIPRKIYPPHETYTNQVWSSPPPKEHLGNFKFKHLPIFWKFFPRDTPWDLLAKEPLVLAGAAQQPLPSGFWGSETSEPTKKAASFGWWVRTLTWFFPTFACQF